MDYFVFVSNLLLHSCAFTDTAAFNYTKIHEYFPWSREPEICRMYRMGCLLCFFSCNKYGNALPFNPTFGRKYFISIHN